jgi:hypothetical protein
LPPGFTLTSTIGSESPLRSSPFRSLASIT